MRSVSRICKGLLARLPMVFAVDLQRLFVARDIAHHGIAVDAGENGGGCAQSQTAQLAMLDLKSK